MKVRRRTSLRTINSGFAIASYDLFLLGFLHNIIMYIMYHMQRVCMYIIITII